MPAEHSNVTSRYHQWRNAGAGGETVFATTTVLAFTRVFRDPTLAEEMAAMLLDDCRHFKVVLHAFVVMPNHVHLLVTLPEGRSISQHMHSLKRRSAAAFLPRCNPRDLRSMAKDPDFGPRSFWQKSFRSVAIVGGDDFWVKVDYINRNPVKKGLVAQPEEYRWTSWRWAEAGEWTEEAGLPLDEMLAFFGGLPFGPEP
jgi:REP element-mobilizing transposase RayT